MIIRNYNSSDCEQLSKLFYQTVHTVNAKDYSREQLDVWAKRNINLKKWDNSFLQNYTIVAIENNLIVGFGDICSSGYLDRLFVHKDYQRQGIATKICNKLESFVNGTITVHSSITAKPFFENRGYILVKEQQVERQGILLKNYLMIKNNALNR